MLSAPGAGKSDVTPPTASPPSTLSNLDEKAICGESAEEVQSTTRYRSLMVPDSMPASTSSTLNMDPFDEYVLHA